MKSISDFNINNKRVLVRCDFDVPLNKRGAVQNDFRVKQAIPTIKYLIKNKAKVILMAHLDRPHGKVIEKLRLTPVQKKLEQYLGYSVPKTSDCIGPETKKQSLELKQGQALLLENLRFHKEEEDNEPEFSKKLAQLGDIYINNAFASSHRKHSSIVGIPKYLPSGAGFLLEKEVKVLSEILKRPKRPLVVIIGGAKIEDKAKVIEKFRGLADYLLIGGKVAEFLTIERVKALYLPLDGVEEKGLVLDIGPKTVAQFSEIIKKAKTIFWAGPMGKFENPLYENGTKKIGQAIVNNRKAYKIVGGGDTLFAVEKFNLLGKFDHISTGGGAMLEFLSGKDLPGLSVLK